MKEKALIAGIVLFAVIIVYFYYAAWEGKAILNKLSRYLLQQNFSEFQKLADSKKAQKYVRPFNLDFMKFNKSIAENDSKAAARQLACFGQVNLNEKQKEAVYSRGFYYFLATGDHKTAEKCYEKLCELKNFAGRRNIDRTYDTYIKKGYQYLDATLKELDTVSEQQRTALEAILADMYHNAGDEEAADKYRTIVAEKIKNTSAQ